MDLSSSFDFSYKPSAFMDYSDFSEAMVTSEYGSMDQSIEHYGTIPFVPTQRDGECGYSGPFIQYSPSDILAIVQVG